ncbi:MAG TPA: hypothetical protein VKA67_00955, partial [Verrucomicrobiae bacterium]|nr:hypothetical protein [Verrucomicrobiae bacterium]
HNIGIPNAGHNVNGMAYMSAMKYLDSSYTQRTTLAANSVVQIAVDLDYYIHQLANPLERLASALPLADLGENELSIKVPTVATDVFTAAAGGVYSVTGEVQLKTLPDVGKADPNLIPFVRTRRVDVNATGLLSGVNISGNAHVRMVHLLARKAGVRSDAVISRVNFNSVAGYERVSDFWKLQMENERENLNLGSLVGTGECFLDFGPEPEQFLNTYGSELVPLSLEAGDTGEVFVTEFGFLRR